jgi:serine/threonine protein kinase|mmetsp:Transcript_58121/g.90408  ORF Transcript_58121/g.90408 Transcript_58121/m.90408 type:complete len:419 (-) Transcript_58121:182-1438(-)|eukprot:CAMPEP_0169340780 /NCGR_PEP_ID=MMETSP1017-20121227/19138_1 /TAXON_ID=342587 /ORGANISM="Karlodinium micrum, Strain CCMP2283" /LENGTH=418 /DNA_ID=CAMNT_0009436417 /DNA_START=42 /DNA_END=1298 /DNA_ORIENTATION=+
MSLAQRRKLSLSIDAVRIPALQSPVVEEKYELHEVLGQGSVAVVRRATRCGSHEQFAVKTMKSDDPEVLLIAERECHLLKKLRHPNIVQIVELIVDKAASRLDIVMSLAGGRRLDVLVKNDGHMTEDVARPLFAQLLHAVHHCHSHRVCHRDIKPENIVITEIPREREDDHRSQSLVLMDFNAACGGGGLTPTGTKPYMSPEAWRTHALYNEMTDLWSCGVCLYFMLAGYLPWVGERMDVLALEVSSFPIRLPAGLSSEALALLAGLLCRDVTQRLLVAAALAHPWCRLSSGEILNVFSNQLAGDSDVAVAQPSYRDWEVKARKAAEAPSQSPLPKTVSWPMICSESYVPASPCHKAATEETWYSHVTPLDRSASISSRDWEVKLRRNSLNTLYGPPPSVPPYRDWELKIRRDQIAAA